MAEEDIGNITAGQFETVSELLAYSVSFQIAFTILIVGLIAITLGYFRFYRWTEGKKFNYTRPHVSRFVRRAVLPFFAIALITSTNLYIQNFELEEFEGLELEDQKINQSSISPTDTFAKILNTINILVIGYTIAHLVPIVLTKREKTLLEKVDFDQWFEMRGFEDDEDGLFHKLYHWVPPKEPPEDMPEEEFSKHLKTKEGLKYLERFRTTLGVPIGGYEKLVDNPFEEWKKSERKKYLKYYESCISGKNQSGRKLYSGAKIDEIYPIDIWREQKRLGSYDPIIAGARPPGYARKQKQGVPKSIKQILPIGIFVAVVLGVVAWWGVDLIILATATGGLAIGVGLAMQKTMENYFAYVMIRKDKIVVEGERIKLASGYNGYVHKITPRVTYLRHPLNESLAIIPTLSLVSAEIINFTKEVKLVPAVIDVGVSYLNDPRQVASILVKVGKRAMKECKDSKGRHLVRHKRCPYLDLNKASCDCDKNLHVDLYQPAVRFNQFNDSSLDFSMWVYVRDFGSQFKVKSDMRIFLYEEFKKYDIRIPWPIRTIYNGDEIREAKEISEFEQERNQVLDEYGIGDLTRGGGGSDDA